MYNSQPPVLPKNHPLNDDNSEMPRIDIGEEFGPDNPNVQVNPIFAALSLGMQQMPGGLIGMKYNMQNFMNATDKRHKHRNVNPRAIEMMMFDPDERTIDGIISLMETRYNEVEELEQRLLNEHLEKLKILLQEEAKREAEEQAKKDSESPQSPESHESQEESNEKPIIEETSE